MVSSTKPGDGVGSDVGQCGYCMENCGDVMVKEKFLANKRFCFLAFQQRTLRFTAASRSEHGHSYF